MLEIFKASVENVRELKKQRKIINRLLNKSIAVNDHSSFDTLKKLYALLYSSFTETSFLKVIHTPYGFSDDEIRQIQSQRNLEIKWDKCVELAFSAIDNMTNKGEIQNKKQTLLRYIQAFIISPSQIRNKIAHGQWAFALNNENSAINDETTQRIKELDFVKIDILFLLYEKIGQAVEDLIESPHKTHFRDFYEHMTALEVLIEETKSWTIETKVALLKGKFEAQKSI